MRQSLMMFVVLLALQSGLPAWQGYAQSKPPDRVEIVYFNQSLWPNIPFLFEVYCNNERQYNYDAVRIYEDGILKVLKLKDCDYYYYDNDLGFIIDRSESQLSRLDGIQEGLDKFIKMFLHGRAFISSFAADASIDKPITTSKDSLIAAMYRIGSYGTTFLWEGVYSCLDAAIDPQTNTAAIRNVVLISDGVITGGGKNLAFRAVKKAKDHDIRLHVLSMGSNVPIKDTLKWVAQETGGHFMHVPNGFYPDQVAASLGNWLRGGWADTTCMWYYKTECADGQHHEVRLEVDVCGKTLTDITYYNAPFDQNRPFALVEIGADTLYYGQKSVIPVTITDVWQPNKIRGFEFTIAIPEGFDLLDVLFDGCALENVVSVDVEKKKTEVTVRLSEDVLIYPVTTTLFKLELAVSDDFEESKNVQLFFIKDRLKLDYCILYRTEPGNLGGIKKGLAEITCQVDTIRAKWNLEESRYEPEEFDVHVSVSNPTPIAVNNPWVKIEVPPGLELLDGSEMRTLGNGVLRAEASTTFRLRALPTKQKTQLEICVESGGDSTDVTRCCTPIVIDKALPYLETWCEVPDSLQWDPVRAAFVPEDFTVTVHVQNNGKIPARNVLLRIDLPESLMLRSWYRAELPLNPDVLMPGESARYTWKVVPMARFSAGMEEIQTTVTVLGEEQTHTCGIYLPVGYPRAELVCGGAKSLYYNDTTKKYSPDLFAVSAELENTSRLPIWNARAVLTIPPFLHFQPGEGPLKLLDTDPLWPGTKRTIYWLLFADGPPIKNAQVCMKVWAPDLPGDSCCIDITTRNTMNPLPELICNLDLPDTIRYAAGAYNPNPFTVDVSVLNIGDTTAGLVNVALHQGADLSISPGDVSLKLISEALEIGHSATTTFSIEVLDRFVSRYDTVRISAYSENGGAVVCEKIIWIEAVRGPILELECRGPDTLRFNDATLSYEPSPFTVYLTATNTGTEAAEPVLAEYLAGPNMALVSGETAKKALTPDRLEVSESGTAEWKVNALPHTSASVDVLQLQVTTSSKLLKAVVPCPVAVHVPPVRTPEISITCEPPVAIAVESHRYLPDPVTFRLHISSIGTAAAFDVEAEAESSSRLVLASGDTKVKSVPIMDAGTGSATLSWNYNPVPSTIGDTVYVTFRVQGRFLGDVYCTAKLYLPPVPPQAGAPEIVCTAPDTVRGDETLREYPTVVLRSEITNNGNAQIDTLTATLHAPSGIGFAANEPGVRTLTAILPGETRIINWALNPVEDTSTVLKKHTVRVRTVSGNDVRFCDIPLILLPFPTAGRKVFALECTAPDTLRYDAIARAMSLGTFPVTVTVTNTGSDALTNITALLTYPSRFLLAEGEEAQKTVTALLPPGESVTVQWMCSAVIRPSDGEAECSISVSADGADDKTCVTRTAVQGHVPSITIEVKKGNVVGFGQTVRVPVRMENPGSVSFTEFRHTIEFDAQSLSLVGAGNSGTLTQYWLPSVLSATEPGRVSLWCSGEAPVSTSGAIYELLFTGVSDEAYSPFEVITSDIGISGPDEIDGTQVTYKAGDITTSGSCVVPLQAGAGYYLQQNTPNPFNPVTTITYRIPPQKQPVETVLEILDVHGRCVRRLDESPKSGGTFSVQFDATGLQSGMYFYRLRAGNRIITRKMVYMK